METIALARMAASSNDGVPGVQLLAPRKVSYLSLPHKSQLAILMLARVAEPMAEASMQSYMFFQLQNFDSLSSPATIASQAGLLFGCKTAAHVCTGMLWARLADSTYGGRKPVLVVGLLSSAIAMLGYGFSQTFAAAIAWQILDGAMNNTVSMVRCVTAELNPHKPHRSRALTLLSICVNMGHFLGSLLGGYLVPYWAQTKDHPHPDVFLSRYPYAAPNMVIAAFNILVALAIIYGLNETLLVAQNSNMNQPSRTWYWNWWRRGARPKHPVLNLHTGSPHDEASPDPESAPLMYENSDQEVQNPPVSSRPPNLAEPSFRRIWAFNVISTMVTYFIIQGHMGTFPGLWAIYISAPLNGGLGLDPRVVGRFTSLQGLFGVIIQIVVYPTLNDRFGPIRLMRAALFVFPVAYFLTPVCSIILRLDAIKPLLWAAVISILFLFMAGRTGVTPATTLLINDCTPHPSVRARIHTTASIVSSISRTIFPPATLAIFGYGLRIGVAGLGFWAIAVLAALACLASMWVVEGDNGGEVKPSIMSV